MLYIVILKGFQAGEPNFSINASITKWSGAEVGMKRAEGYKRNHSAGVSIHGVPGTHLCGPQSSFLMGPDNNFGNLCLACATEGASGNSGFSSFHK